MTLATMLTEAARHLGYRENGARFTSWYGAPAGTAWCAIFVSYVAAHSGNASLFPRFQYTPTGAAWFKTAGRWGTAPRPGALVFYDFPDTVFRIQHVGIVEKVLPDGRIQTIEGNTVSGETGSQYAGGGVYRRTRTTSSVVGYGYPAYAPETMPAPAPAPPAPAPAGDTEGDDLMTGYPFIIRADAQSKWTLVLSPNKAVPIDAVERAQIVGAFGEPITVGTANDAAIRTKIAEK